MRHRKRPPVEESHGHPGRKPRQSQAKRKADRLTFDLEDLRAKSARYRELANHWDLDDPETAALFDRLAREDATLCRVIGDLVARSDPHAED